jgi:hypothetical protein
VYLLCIDVGPVRPTDFTKTQRRPQLEEGPTIIGGPIAIGGPQAKEGDRVL